VFPEGRLAVPLVACGLHDSPAEMVSGGGPVVKKTCERCGREALLDIVIDDSTEVCGHNFTASMPATRCAACRQVVIQADQVKRFERRIAVELAKAAVRSADGFRFFRTVLEMTQPAVAELLDVPVDYVGYWETGKWPVDPRAMAVLASLTLGRFDGQHASLDCLRVLRMPRKLSAKVRLHLDDSAHGAKGWKFGDTPRKVPATA
jgi:DNA-binding transcriptional regulator YiaG